MANGWTLGSVVYVRYQRRKIFPRRLLRLLSIRGGDIEANGDQETRFNMKKVADDVTNVDSKT